MMWNNWVIPLWTIRDKLKYGRPNIYDTEEDIVMVERILWYMEHKHELLAHHDQFLAQIDITRLCTQNVMEDKENMDNEF